MLKKIRQFILKIKTELFFLKLKFFKGVDKKQLEKSVRCTFKLEHTIIPDISYNEYLKEFFYE